MFDGVDEERLWVVLTKQGTVNKVYQKPRSKLDYLIISGKFPRKRIRH